MGSILLAIHLLGVVLWVGGMAFALMVLRPGLSVVEPAQRLALLAQVFRRFFLIVWHAMPLILATGYGMVFGVYNGFGNVNPAVHSMHLFGLIMSAVFIYIFFSPWPAMRKALAPGDRATAGALADRIRKLIAFNLALGLIVVIIAPFGR